MGVLSTLQPLIGLVGILGLAYALSTNRKAISLRVVGWGLSLQVLFALIVLKTSIGQQVFGVLGDKMRQLLEFSVVGSGFVFGALGDASVWSPDQSRRRRRAMKPTAANPASISA